MATGAATVALVAAWLTRPTLALDDAAISFRYAARLAEGAGFTYNDGAHVLGASSALHTLLLAALTWLGLSTPTAGLALGLAGMAACAALVALISMRLGGLPAAVVAVTIFVASPVRWYATGGLESATLIAWCLAAVLARQTGRDRLAGVALGLALVTKLDAGALVVAITVSALIVRRRLPSTTLAVAALTAAPWFAWATWRFGGPLPQSFLSKVSGGADAPGYRYDPTWVIRPARIAVPAAVAGVGVAAARWREQPGREARLTIGIWSVGATTAVALLPLGAAYPWYLTPVWVTVALLAGDAGAWAWARVARAGRPTSRAAGATAIVAILLAATVALGLRTLAADLVDGRAVGPAETQWRDLRAAGRHIERHHPGAVVENCYGWTGFAAPSATIVDPCGLTSTGDTSRATVAVDSVSRTSPAPRPGWCDEATFDELARRTGVDDVIVVRVRC